MKHKIYRIDAFTDKIFSENPIAVQALGQCLSDDILKKVAINQSC